MLRISAQALIHLKGTGAISHWLPKNKRCGRGREIIVRAVPACTLKSLKLHDQEEAEYYNWGCARQERR